MLKLPSLTALSFQTASTVSPGFRRPKLKVFWLALWVPPGSDEPANFGYLAASTQTGRSGWARSGGGSLIVKGREELRPSRPPTEIVMVRAGTVFSPVLRAPSFSRTVSLSRCSVGNSAVTPLAGYLPEASSGPVEESPPQAANDAPRAAKAAPARSARRRKSEAVLSTPKAARTYHDG